ncbi:MAG: hypothetical protein ACQKBU_01920 [Verrucomicrobiales bacterium]
MSSGKGRLCWQRWLYPRISFEWLPTLLGVAGLGAIMAGTYGAIHDLVTFRLSPEYYTKFKFLQFAEVDFGWSDRAFVVWIGFLATWWVGLLAGWLLARFAVRPGSGFLPLRRIVLRLGGVLVGAVLGSLVGAGFGRARVEHGLPDSWLVWQDSLGIVDLEAFARVAYIHNFGYAGAAFGLIAASVSVIREKTRSGLDGGGLR